MRRNISSEVRGVASDVFAVDVDILNGTSSPETVESWDSVQHLTFVVALEERFNIQFQPDEMDQMNNLGAVTQLLERKLAGPAAGATQDTQ